MLIIVHVSDLYIYLNQFLIGHFSKALFLMLIKLDRILPIYVHLNGQTLSGVFEQFSFTSKFLGLIMQKLTGFECSFYKIED